MKHKILSFLTAFAMVFGIVAAPFVNASAAEDENISKADDAVTNTVTLHKLMMNEQELKDWAQITEDKYDGTQGTKELLKNLTNHSAHEVPDVYFALKFAKDYGTTAAEKAMAGKYVKASGTTKEQKLVPANPVAATDNIEEAVGGLTTDNGIEFTTSTLKGKFEIDEITSKTTYKKADGTIITASKAVPVEITLPLVNSKGTVLKAHVYPKNTENKPQIDKNFGKKDNTTDNKTDNDLVHAEGFDTAQAGAQEGAKYENYSKTKETAKAEIGKTIPYEVKTEIPANSKLATAKWDDKMTEGLTYNKDLKVIINGKVITPSTEGEDPELVQTDNGFSLSLKGDNLALLNGQASAVTVFLQYTAKVNKDAMADIPESNNVMFHYGNNPSKSTTPIPTNPKNGELEVKKTWDDGVWAKGESATFKLIDANTGKEVTADDLVAPEGDQTAFNEYKAKFSATAKIGYDAVNGGSHKWQYLDDTKEYIAKEISSTSGSDAEYKKSDDGTITVVNHRSDNPTPLNPTSPKVVVGGKKFVKTVDKEAKDIKAAEDRLAGAEFYVKNSKNEYLVAKTSTEQNAANVDLTAKKEALDAAVKAFNDLTAEEQKTDTEKRGAIDTAQDAYNKAFKAAAQNYKWEKDSTNAVLLVSDAQGRFEISGLEYGTYKLEEKTAPKDYAKISDVEFTVAKGSYGGKKYDEKNSKYLEEPAEKHIQYNKDDKKANYGLQVRNKKVTIPQTGGIGSIIFVVAGLMIMGLAAYKMKANKEQA